MVKPRLRKRLGDLLVEEGVISNDQLMAALKNQKGKGIKLGASLIDLGYINEEQLLKFLAKQLNIPFYDLSKVKIDQAAVQLIPEVQARRLRVLCIHAEPDRATVVMSDPADLNAMDSVAALLMPREIEFAVARESQLLTSFGQLYRKTKEIESFASQLQEEYKASDFDMGAAAEAEGSENEATVVKLLRMIFEDAVQVHASDIHIEPDEKVLRIRQRIDGVLHETDLNEVGIAPALVLRLKLMSGLNISEKRLPQDGRFKIRARGHDVDVRISTLPIQNGESVVMRLLDQTSGLLNLNDVGMPPQILEKFRRELHRPHGLILVTGPTGSGKTTTLYGALSELNEPGTKIITAEDPVEFRLPRVSQVQINASIGLDFSRVLRACLRQDPDIILVGEMRDKETCEIGLRGAITGHLVLTTLHTNDAVSSALRLMDMGAPGYLVAAALRVVIAQRLVRRICPDCKEEYVPDESDRRFIDDVIGPGASQHVFYHGRGCQSCNYTGYKGRIGVFEILDLKGEMMDALRAEDTERFSRAANADPDYVPLSHMAYDYALQGITSLDEVLRLAEIAK
ncbi:MAG: GspE/PulE family protein [Succinivibrionaceae bacterium]|nr:Flp pilus assembly complex ATPase component TadA [Succinivibrionaceae bacterium]MCI6200342.1 GspE/PulE family protein [Pseudomonadota bacterium]MDD6545581.1 GspE/PulE family protein [Pseudomonadota bacterium]MDY3145134.1 GspE/PulE family protein [Succinivibrionaceae bacterium]